MTETELALALCATPEESKPWIEKWWKENKMAEPDALTLFEALEQLLINRKWLQQGEVRALAQQLINQRAALGEAVPGEPTEA